MTHTEALVSNSDDPHGGFGFEFLGDVLDQQHPLLVHQKVEEAESVGGDDAIDGWRVSLRHHNLQRQNYTKAGSAGSIIENAKADFAIENAKAGSAIKCFCSRIVVSQTDARTDYVN